MEGFQETKTYAVLLSLIKCNKSNVSSSNHPLGIKILVMLTCMSILKEANVFFSIIKQKAMYCAPPMYYSRSLTILQNR